MKKIFIIIIILLFVIGGCNRVPIQNDGSGTSAEIDNDKDITNGENDPKNDSQNEEENNENLETEPTQGVPSDNETEVSEKPEDEQPIEEEIVEAMFVISDSGLNLRKHPQINGEKLVLMPYGSKVVVLNDESVNDVIDNIKGKWINIKYENLEGWAFNAYLDYVISDQETEDESDEQPTFSENNDNIDIAMLKIGDEICNLKTKNIEKVEEKTTYDFEGQISLTGEIVRNYLGAVLIPDKEYSNLFPKIEAKDVFYIDLVNFGEAEEKHKLNEEDVKVQVILDQYKIISNVSNADDSATYCANIVNIKKTSSEGTPGYKGKTIEGCFIDNKVQLKDTICGMSVIHKSVDETKNEDGETLYKGSMSFKGEVILKASYQYIIDGLESRYIFNVNAECLNKIPHFKSQEKPNFILENVDESIKTILGNKGEAMIIVKNYDCHWMVEEEISSAELVELISVEKEEDI